MNHKQTVLIPGIVVITTTTYDTVNHYLKRPREHHVKYFVSTYVPYIKKIFVGQGRTFDNINFEKSL